MFVTDSILGANPLLLTAAFAGLAVSLLVLVTIFLRRRRSRRELVERVAELEALSTAGRALVASELDLDALCELIAHQAGQIIDNQTFQVGLFEDRFYDIRYWTIDGVPQPVPQMFDLAAADDGDDQGLVGWVRDEAQPLLIGDFSQEMDQLPAQPQYERADPPRSALFIPLVSGDRAIGVLSAQSHEPFAYSEQDARRLTILANQAAAAIANAKLFSQEQMRAAHLELVGQIARQVNAVQDLDQVFEEVVQLTEETFGFHPVNIFGMAAEPDEMVIRASSIPEVVPNARSLPATADTTSVPAHRVRLALGEGIVGGAAASHLPIVVNNTRADERFIAHLPPLPETPGARTLSEIAIPLIVDHELLGVLDVQSTTMNAFGAAEQTVLEALAAEIAIAIHKAQQLTRQQEQAWITTAELQVAEAIGRSSDLDEMVAAVARLTPILTGDSFCAILLWDDEAELYTGQALVDAAGDLDETFDDIIYALGDWPALDAVHVGHEPLTTAQTPGWSHEHLDQESSCLRLYPLLDSRSVTVGALVVDLSADAPCDDNRADLSSPDADSALARRREELRLSIARQAARGIESARLRIAQQEEAWVNTALLQVAEAVSSLTDLDDILSSIVRLVPLLVGVDSVFVLVWNEDRQIFQAGPSYGVSSMGRGLVETLEIARSEFLAMSPHLAADFEAPLTRASGLTYYPLRIPTWLKAVLDAPAAYNFSLVARGRLVGSMIVSVANPPDGRPPFSNRRANILNGIAQQAATAVVNNQLYIESAERSRLQQELDVAHNIQASFLPDGSPDILGCTVASYWQAARQVSGDFYDFLQLADGKWGIVIADVADKGVPAALYMALSRTILRTVAFSRDDPAKVLVRVNEILEREAKSDLFVTMFYAIWEPERGRLRYANAGHNPPLLMQANGQVRLLDDHGMALGVLPSIQLQSHTATIKPDETVIMYTDGVTEALNVDYDEFGMERLEMAARAAAGRDATAIVNRITDDVRDHVGETPQFDDITLVVMKRHEVAATAAAAR